MSDTSGTRSRKVRAWSRPAVRELAPYYDAPLDGDPLRLDQNTNLAGANPALERVDPRTLDLAQYPSRDSTALLQALGKAHGLAPQQLLAGNGSDELLDILCKTFTSPGERLVTTDPCYSLYPYYCTLHELELVRVGFAGRLSTIDLEGLLAPQGKITLIASPNNPTGAAEATDALEELAKSSKGLVVVDEAYIEYSDQESLVHRVEDHDNLIVLRTMSKAHGLAGLRVGWACANAELATRLRIVKPPFNVNHYAEAVVAEALREPAWMEAHVERVRRERTRLARELTTRGWHIYPSDANFLLCHPPASPQELHASLLDAGVLARIFPGRGLLSDCIRFTVGEREHNDRLLAAIDTIEVKR